jgi:hypothetical protein
MSDFLESDMAQAPFAAYWPRGRDGTKRFPENHRLLLESSRMKVVDVFIAARSAEKPHTHRLESFMFTDQPAPIEVRWVDAARRLKLVYARRRALKRPRRPYAHAVAAEPLHFVTNIGRRDYLATRVEFKAGAVGILQDCPVAPGGSLILDAGYEAVVVGRTGASLRVMRRAGARWRPLEPLDNGQDRPQVWHLPAGTHKIENPAKRAERVYRLTLKTG